MKKYGKAQRRDGSLENEFRVLFTGMWPFYVIRFTFGKVRVKLCFFQLIKVHHVHKNGSWGETCGFLKLRWWYCGGDKKGGTLWERAEPLFIHITGKKNKNQNKPPLHYTFIFGWKLVFILMGFKVYIKGEQCFAWKHFNSVPLLFCENQCNLPFSILFIWTFHFFGT